MSDTDKTRILDTNDLDRTRIVASPGSEHTIISDGTPLPRSLALTAIPGNTHGYASHFNREHILFEIKAMSGGARGGRLPLNIALVIDRSGSMEGEPLEYAKRACGYVVDLLEPNDILSVVTFEEQADVIMPARRVVNKALVKEYINRIYAGNTTNLYEGLMLGCQQVASVKSESTLNRVLLLTDGEPTAGTKDYSSIVGQVGEQKSRGITVTALGFGPDYNEELMTGIARRSGGNYYHIGRPELIPEVFRRELDTLMRITARNLRLRVHLSRGVTVRQIYGQQPTFGNRMAEVTLTDLERDARLSSLWEFEISPRPPGTYKVGHVELVYDDAATGRFEKIFDDAIILFTDDPSEVEHGVNPRVRNEIEAAQAARALDRTIMSVRTQQIDRTIVMQELNQTKTLMLDRGMLAQAQEITQAITDIQGGSSIEKTLVGAIYHLDQGKTH